MKILRYTLICMLTALMSNCSIRTDLFVQNLTSESVLFKIIYNSPIEISDDKENIFQYGTGIIKPKRFLKKKNLQSLNVNRLNEYTLTVEIPENSTSRIEATSNYRFFHDIDRIEFNNQKYTIEEFVDLTFRQKSHYVYKVDL